MIKYATVEIGFKLHIRPANGKQGPATMTNKKQDNLSKYRARIFLTSKVPTAQESIPRNLFRQAVLPDGSVGQPYSYPVPSPHILFKNSSTVYSQIRWSEEFGFAFNPRKK